MIEIYGKPQCPFFFFSKALCKAKGYEYTYKSLGTDFGRDEMMETFPDARTFPQIIAEGNKIGGYDKLEEWFLSRQAWT